MKKQISYLVPTVIIVLVMISCEDNFKENDYSLTYSNYNSREKNTTWNGWRISVISEYTLWYNFESKKFSGDKTFYFTHLSTTAIAKDSITVRDILPGDKFSIGVNVFADGGTYTVNQTSTSGSIMHYWIGYNDYSQMIKLWTNDMVVTETVNLKRRITAFDSFRAIER